MVKNLQCRRLRFEPWVGKISWRRKWPPTPVFLPGEFHGQRNLASYSPWGLKESDTTEWRTLTLHINSLFTRQLHFLFFLCLRKNPWLSTYAQVTPVLVFLVLSISINCPTPTLVAQGQSLGAVLSLSLISCFHPIRKFCGYNLQNSSRILPNSLHLPSYHFGQSHHHFPWHLFELECCF